MPRETGTCRTSTSSARPPERSCRTRFPQRILRSWSRVRHAATVAALGLLRMAGAMVLDPSWILYGSVRKEAVLSSQIENAQATLRDVATFESTSNTGRPADVEEICNCVDALNHARAPIADPHGPPLSTRLLRDVHRSDRRPTPNRVVSTTRGQHNLIACATRPIQPLFGAAWRRCIRM
ncbi:MAG: hypothetical protein JJU33_12530 [Phycisphaerales bacterium]|nr:hypothetical protein [Phycisphaerales bacterium]